MFAEGKGVENSEGIAFGLYVIRKICGAGDQRGCFGMGTLYERGRGIKKDGDKAVDLYQQSLRFWLS